MQIVCKTLFDCSPTGVTGHYRISSIPFVDAVGQSVHNQLQWNFSRNQQRNWETLTQLISLRTQPINIELAQHGNGMWQFVFEVEQPLVYSTSGLAGDFDALISECNGVPMILGLNETMVTQPVLIAAGQDQNIWFEAINNELN
jgi:hypothetical protein